MIAGQIRAELLDLETTANWKRNPIDYLWLFGNTIDGLIKRDFAPPRKRLRSLTSRLRAIPPAVEAMKANIVDSPKEFTDLGIKMARGSIGFFGSTLEEWASKAADGTSGLLEDFKQAHQPAADAIEKAAAWLEERCCIDRGGDGIRPFPSGSVRRCVRTRDVRVRSLCSELSGRPESP